MQIHPALRCAGIALFVLAGIASAAAANEVEDEPIVRGDEDGCLDGRVKNYLNRHGDYGRIEPESVLYETQRVKNEIERDRPRGPRPLAINGTVWTNIGPTNGAGRLSAAAPHPTVSGTIIVGAAGGGAWKSTDYGATWTALTDSIANLSVGAIAYAPSNTSIVYLGTGEGGYAFDFIPGIGLLKSTDGGVNWTLPTSVVADMFYRILVHPTNPDEVLIATEEGAFRSTTGQNGPWTAVIPAATYGDVTDLVRDPSNANIIYAATSSGSVGTPKVLKSTNSGQTWTDMSTGLPADNASQTIGRVALAIAPSNPQILYAAMEIYPGPSSHIYKTINGGTSWTATALSGSSCCSAYMRGQGWYDNSIIVSPANADIVIAGGVGFARTVDGGTNWVSPLFAGGSMHVDSHDLRYDSNNTLLYFANDGGLWTSTDNGDNTVNRNTNLVTRQFYALAIDPANRNRVYGGQQDNGSIARLDAGGTVWSSFHHSDGFQGGVNDNAPQITYATTQYGSIVRTPQGGTAGPKMPDKSPVYESGEFAPFFTLVKLDPSNPATVYTGTHRVWKSTTAGDSWLPLPTTTSGPTTWDPNTDVSSIAVAKSNPNIIMVSKYARIYRSTDGGNNWVGQTTANGLPNKYITNVEIDPIDSSKAYVTFAGQSGTALYYTLNGGTTWTARGTGLPAFSAQVVRIDPTDSNRLFCGTDVGVYHSTDGGANWSRFGTGMPAVSVYDLRSTSDGAILRAATHGRGIWELNVTGVTNTVPTVAISSPATTQTIARGSSVTFTGTFSDAETSATATWTFPDTWTTIGATSGVSVSHQFDRPGRFPVSLVATDTNGAKKAAYVEVIVNEPGELCDSPIVIPSAGPYPYTVTVETEEAVREPATDPAGSVTPYYFGGFTPQRSIWVQWTAPAAGGTYNVSACGSKISVLIAGFSTPSTACATSTTNYVSNGITFTNTGPNADCGADASQSFVATGGATYRFLISTYFTNEFGQVSMTINPTSAPSSSTPVVMAVDPPVGTTTGGTVVTITGSGFTVVPSVTFGGVAATGVTRVTDELLTAITPAHSAGLVDVRVGANATVQNAFTFADGTPTVTITANDATASEAGPTTGQFTLTRTGSTASALTVLCTFSGTAVNGTDYSALTTPIEIPAGSASVTVTVTPINDSDIEGDETVILTINPGSYAITTSSATVTITSDDLPVVTIAATDNEATEVGNTIGIFTVTRTGPTTSPLTVNFTIGGTATNGSDYSTMATSVIIDTGASSRAFSLMPIDDATAENDETAILTLASGTGYTIGGANTATVTIKSDDISVSVTANDPTAAEAGLSTGQFTITRLGPTTSALSVNLTMSGSATNDVDYNGISSPATILAGNSSVLVTVTPIDDAAIEGDESVIMTLNAGTGYTVGSPSSATVTLTSDEVAPTVTITANDATATEAGPTTGQFTVTRTGSTAAALTVSLTIGGTATNGTDYNTITSPVFIVAGSATATITITPINDTAVEPDETVVLTVAANAAYVVGSPSSATVTIQSEDTTVSVSANDATATEAGPTTGQFTITRNGPSASALAVNITIGGTATNGSDYATISSPVTIPAGLVSTTVTVTPIDESSVEPDETVSLTLAAGSGYTLGSPTTATVTIVSDDVEVTVTATDSIATEAGATTGQFTVTRNGGTTATALSVNITMSGTASPGSDYNAITSPIAIPSGLTSTTVTVTPINDADIESPETVILTLNSGTGYTIGTPGNATVEIQSDDAASQVTIVANDATATEAGPTNGQFTLTRTGSTASSLQVNVTIGGTAANADDYAFLTSPVTIAAGSATATVNVQTLDDATVEVDETVTLTITAGPGYAIGSPSEATVTITSDDVGAPSEPTNVVATGISTTSVVLTWNASPGATGYQIIRRDDFGAGVMMAGAVTTYTDTSASPNKVYVYWIRAVGPFGMSGDSNTDLATTVMFTNDPLVAGSTQARAIHVNEARTAINAARATAGLAAKVWTETIIAGVTIIKTSHFDEMRTALNEAFPGLGFPAPIYTDPILTGLRVKAVHLQQLRTAVK